jgi:glyoxylase-like metal-dependent hydrolase (beta-lactamase superfamily II)
MPAARGIAPGVHLVLEEDALAGGFSSVYLVSGPDLALIETGPSSSADRVIAGIRRAGFVPEEIRFIIPTHIHIDHGGGVGLMAEKIPDAEILLHPRAVRHMIDPTKLIESTAAIRGPDWEQMFGPVVPVPEDRIRPIDDGDIVYLGDRELKVFYTPGHAPHHVSLQDSESGFLFGGETVGAYVSELDMILPAVTPPAFDLEGMLDDLKRLDRLDSPMLCFSHFAPTADVRRLLRKVGDRCTEWGEVILRELKATNDVDAVCHRLKEDLFASLTGVRSRQAVKYTAYIESFAGRVAVLGYQDYFRRQGLLD